MRSVLLNDTFASWIAHGVEKLYVNLKRMDENHKFNEIDQMQKVLQSIEEIIKWVYNVEFEIQNKLKKKNHQILSIVCVFITFILFNTYVCNQFPDAIEIQKFSFIYLYLVMNLLFYNYPGTYQNV